MAFIDIKKAYDSVPRSELWKAIEEIAVERNLVRAIKDLYKQNMVSIKTGKRISCSFKTTKGLLQGCPISPTLFKIYLEKTLKNWKRGCEGMGVPVRNEHLYTLSFADDQVVIAQDEEDLSFMIRKLQEAYTKAGLEINFKKTEYLNTKEEEVKDLEIGENQNIKGTSKFKYLGFVISKNATTEEEIKSRLGQTRTSIRQLNSLLWNRHITKTTKKRIYESIVQSIMTYGAENWVINKKK